MRQLLDRVMAENPELFPPSLREGYALHGFARPSEIGSRPRLYLHEHERVAVAADDVHLASARSAKISVENLVALPVQETRGQFFPAPAEIEMRSLSVRLRKENRFAQPVQKIADESNKAHARAV